MACGEPAPRRKAVRFSLLPIDCPGYTPSLEISTNYYDFGVINSAVIEAVTGLTGLIPLAIASGSINNVLASNILVSVDLPDPLAPATTVRTGITLDNFTNYFFIVGDLALSGGFHFFTMIAMSSPGIILKSLLGLGCVYVMIFSLYIADH
jgi:hypothetical protein